MKYWILLISFVTSFTLAAQIERSEKALVYRPATTDLLQYAESLDKIALLAALQKQKPVDTLWSMEADNQLPSKAGVYILVYTAGTEIQFSIHNKQPLDISLTDHSGTKRLYVFSDSSQVLLKDVQVYHNGKDQLKYLPKEKAFKLWAPFKSEGRFVIVHQGVPSWYHWSESYRYNRAFSKVISWLDNILSGSPSSFGQKGYQQKRKPFLENMSYLAINKPIFRKSDSLYLKAFILKKNEKPLQEPIFLELAYYDYAKSKNQKKILDTLVAYRPGAYRYSWLIPDSLLGKKVNLNLMNQKDELLQTRQFKVEDYSLNKVLFSAKLLNSENDFHPNFPIKLSYQALDDLGLSPMQGRIRLQASINYPLSINLPNTVVLPNLLVDTLLALDPTGRGIISLDPKKLPPFSGELKILLAYLSSDGERHEKNFMASWKPKIKAVHLEQNSQGLWVLNPDSLLDTEGQEFYLQGSSTERENDPYLKSNKYGLKSKIKMPFTFTNGLPKIWQLSAGDDILANETDFTVESTGHTWFQRNDTLLYFPLEKGHEPVLLKIIANGKHHLFSGFLKDTLRIPSDYRYLQVFHPTEFNYHPVDFIALKSLLKKEGSPRLNIEAKGPGKIFPGETANWKLKLSKSQKPLADYDILALAYKEKQFENTLSEDASVLNFKIKRPRYKKIPQEYLIQENIQPYSTENSALISKVWRKQLGADSLIPFKYMFPQEGLESHYLPLDSPNERPQFAPFIYSGGRQHLVRYFALNDRPLFINDLGFEGYSAQLKAGMHSIEIRIRNKKITVPKVQMKEGFKTELALDLEHLPEYVKVEEMPPYYSEEEIQFLIDHVSRFYLPLNTLVYQDYQHKLLQHNGSQWIGPFRKDEFNIITEENQNFRLIFKGASNYKFDVENRILTVEECASTAEKVIIRSFFNQSFNQFPGFQIKKPTAPTSSKQSKHLVSVNALPTEEESEDCYIQLVHMYGSEAVFVHHISTGRFYATESYQQNQIWPSGKYQIFDISKSSAMVSDTFVLNPHSTAYLSPASMQFISLPQCLKRLDSISAAVRNSPNMEKRPILGTGELKPYWGSAEGLDEVIIRYEAPLIDATKSSQLTSVSEIQNMAVRDITSIAAQAAGVTVNFRGARSEGARSEGSVYFIDGVKMRGSVNLPQAAISERSINTVFKGSPLDSQKVEPESLAAHGGGLRSEFKDYAFFIPDLKTDEQGEVNFRVQYPDDRANWSTYFVGMGRKGNYAYSKSNTLAFSPVSAELATPRYLHQGDSCVLIGKTLNYLDSSLSLQTQFSLNGDTQQTSNTKVDDALIEYLSIRAKDSLTLTYTLRLANGFTDGEKRIIPVLRNGLTKQEGYFLSLKNDTSLSLTFDSTQTLHVGIMRSNKEFLQEEVDLQMSYSHYCNEQMASKLKAILAANIINEEADRYKDYHRKAKKLISKLLANRNSENLWGWWGKQATNPFMSAYVLQSLLEAKAAGYSVNINSSIAQVIKTLPELRQAQQIDYLYLLQAHKLAAPYDFYLKDGLSRKTTISSHFKRAILALELGKPFNKAQTEAYIKNTILGQQYLPEDAPYSLQGKFSNTLLALEYFTQTKQTQRIEACLSYLLLGRQSKDLNTIERAALIKALSTYALADSVETSLSYQVNNGPVQVMPENKKRFTVEADSIRFLKKGKGQAFASVTSAQYYPNPIVDDSHFKVKSSWEKAPQVGEITNLNLEIEAKESAEYLMIEIPLPAGCTLQREESGFYRASVYEELRGDKVYLYLRKIEGRFKYSLPLLARYAGEFALNPIKIELMYFPALSGNNTKQNVVVKAADKIN